MVVFLMLWLFPGCKISHVAYIIQVPLVGSHCTTSSSSPSLSHDDYDDDDDDDDDDDEDDDEDYDDG